jgi:geranylgeranyl reductase family protein
LSVASPAYDAIVVGGGPAGAVAAWRLTGRGARVLVLERTGYPREKVCGDYVEPRGLRILQALGCLEGIEAEGQLPITHSATYVDGRRRYGGEIPFYGLSGTLPPHGYIVRRERLDHLLIQAALRAGAELVEQAQVTGVEASAEGVVVRALRGGREHIHRARAVVGADGVNSVVANAVGLLTADARHLAVSKRAYATGIDADVGEAAFFFEERLFPGYGWMFPMRGGVVNLGVGVLSEARDRLRLSVPALFDGFLEELRRSHPRCAGLELLAPPIGGIVKTYGAAGPNHFAGGVLVGDAGCFVDPMTGEGITPAMESALLAADVLLEALAAGDCSAAALSAYERRFREYFDPAMLFVDLLAALMRNRRLAKPWLKLMARGCEVAQADREFGRVAGGYFGGLDVRPSGILSQIWLKMAQELLLLFPRGLAAPARGGSAILRSLADLAEWQVAWTRSFVEEPVWAAGWLGDVQRKWLRAFAAMTLWRADPRAAGLV